MKSKCCFCAMIDPYTTLCHDLYKETSNQIHIQNTDRSQSHVITSNKQTIESTQGLVTSLQNKVY